MAGSLYSGNMGAGKTYGAVRFGIIPALQRRQRVVTNIPCNIEKIQAHLGFNIDGLIVVVSNEDVEAPGFWYSEDYTNSIVQPGDFVIIDEAWQFFGTDKRLKTDHPAFSYLRLHRKFTDPTSGFSSEVWYVTQDYNDISRSFRSVCDFHLFMEKLKVVGKPDEFRVDYFSNCRVSPQRQQPFKQQFYKYDPAYFELYHSYASSSTSINADQAGGVEIQADDRMNYWNQRMFFGLLSLRHAMIASGVVASVAISYLIYFFASLLFNSQDAVQSPKTPDLPPVVEGPAVAPPFTSPDSTPSQSERPLESAEYRLVGLYRFDGLPMAVVTDRSGAYRYLSPFEFEQVWAGPLFYIRHKDRVIAPWTGPQQSLLQKMETSK